MDKESLLGDGVIKPIQQSRALQGRTRNETNRVLDVNEYFNINNSHPTVLGLYQLYIDEFEFSTPNNNFYNNLVYVVFLFNNGLRVELPALERNAFNIKHVKTKSNSRFILSGDVIKLTFNEQFTSFRVFGLTLDNVELPLLLHPNHNIRYNIVYNYFPRTLNEYYKCLSNKDKELLKEISTVKEISIATSNNIETTNDTLSRIEKRV